MYSFIYSNLVYLYLMQSDPWLVSSLKYPIDVMESKLDLQQEGLSYFEQVSKCFIWQKDHQDLKPEDSVFMSALALSV